MFIHTPPSWYFGLQAVQLRTYHSVDTVPDPQTQARRVQFGRSRLITVRQEAETLRQSPQDYKFEPRSAQ